jgi:glycosyltransferase involved in cell wall biosynthesis
MKKLCIAANHSWPHCGGSEIVIRNISEAMTNKFGWETFVFSQTTQNQFKHNNVNYIKVNSFSHFFIDQINNIKPDYLFIYSDFFIHWLSILQNYNKIKCRKGISLVGMNMMLSKPNIIKMFKNNSKHFDVITHSDNYQDFKNCSSLDIPVTVIPNGVDINEFSITENNFREKYKIDSKYILLCVSNFFPGKGQEYLLNILEKLKDIDFTMVFICSTVNFNLANLLRETMRQKFNKTSFKYKILLDIPREDIISAYKNSDVFIFPSQKEVAPLVILESMAAGLPWVSMPVGNISELQGGLLVNNFNKNYQVGNGFLKDAFLYNENTYNEFADNIKKILNDEDVRKKLSVEGKSLIKEKYNWNDIYIKYHNIFEGK